MQIFAFDLNVYIHNWSIGGGGGYFYIDYRNEIIVTVIHVIGIFDFILIYLRLDNNEPKLAYNRQFYHDKFFLKQFN